MGIVVVAAAALCKGEVALARIRSTPSDTNPLQMVAAVVCSPCAFCRSNFTLSPSFSFKASWNPWVAASRASCSTSWQIPMLYTLPSVEAALVAAASLWAVPVAAAVEAVPLSVLPQPVRTDAAITAVSTTDNNFFFIINALFSADLSIRLL